MERLDRNTRPVDEVPPEVADPQLAGLMAKAHAAGDRYETRQAVAELTGYANDRLTAMMEGYAVGIEPSVVMALAWIDRQQFQVLQSLTYEDQMRLPRQEWFSIVMKFHELRHNQSYDEAEFNHYMDSLKGMGE